MSKSAVQGKWFMGFLIMIGMMGCNPPVPNEVRPDFPPTDQNLEQSPTSLYNRLLLRHVNRKGDIHYRGFQSDSLEFNVYIDFLSSQNPAHDSWSESERLAFWINAYNAHVIRLVIRHYPLGSVADIGKSKDSLELLPLQRDSSAESLEIYNKPFVYIGGMSMSLNGIKTRIREDYKDPRIHFVLVDGTVSAPRLMRKAYTSEDLATELENATAQFFELPGKNFISPTRPQLSPIFREYADDFSANGGVYSFINTYSKVKIREDAAPVFLPYDWKLNGY
jgi:hypothetical protein